MSNLYVLGGPNGAGKTTIALRLLPEFLGCDEFVNADSIAAGLSPFKPESVALQAGRLMLQRLHQLSDASVDFAFESTLASRTFTPFLQECKERGYTVHLLYIWLQSADLAVQRVAQRVLAGGHSIPEATVRRRYESGRRNLVSLYLPLADFWKVYDNTGVEPQVIAEGWRDDEPMVYRTQIWQSIMR